MKYSRVLILGILCINSLTALSQYKKKPIKDTIEYKTLDTLVVKAKPGLPPYQASSPRTWEITNTRVALSFNWREKTATAKEWIQLHPYCFATDTLVMDAKGMHIDSVLIMGKKGSTPLAFRHINDKLTVLFTRQYQASDNIELVLKYVAKPYSSETGDSSAISDDRGLYFINTDYKVPNKPAEIWTQGETESNSHWMITIDKPNTRFTTQIELTVPDSFTTLSNGALISQVKGKNGLRTDVWKMDMPIQAYAVMFAIGKYSIIKDSWKTKQVNYYVEPEFAPYAKKMFSNTPEMLEFFSKCTGVPYPWNKYSQVVARDYVSGAMENTSASLFGEFMNQTAREMADKNSEDVVSHELFHQWFGDYVTCESWSNITVNESFANYGEQLWREYKYGKPYRDELAWDDLQKYIYASRLRDPQLVRLYYDNREEVFDAISYNKGGAILHYLNTMIGDAAFNLAMKIYLTKNALHSAEAHNWRMAVEEATGLDWNWFFNQWYYHAGHPVLKINYNYDDDAQMLGVSVTQIQDDSIFNYKLPIKTALIYGSQKTLIDWTISKKKDSFSYPYMAGMRPVIVPDYLHVLPGEIKESKKPAEWLAQYTNSDSYVNRKLAISGAAKQLSDTIAQHIVDMGLACEMKAIRRYTLTILGNQVSDEYRKKWLPKVIEMANTEKDNITRAEAFTVLGNWKVDTAKTMLVKALADSSYTVAGNALDALYKIDNDTAWTIAQKLWNANPRSILKYSIWTIIGKKGADNDVALYEAYAANAQGAQKVTFGNSLSNFMKHVTSDTAFKRGVTVFQQLIRQEDRNSTRKTLAGIIAKDADDYKTDMASADNNEAATARTRFDILKSAFKEIAAEEKDAANAEYYNKSMKSIFNGE